MLWLKGAAISTICRQINGLCGTKLATVWAAQVEKVTKGRTAVHGSYDKQFKQIASLWNILLASELGEKASTQLYSQFDNLCWKRGTHRGYTP